MLKKNSTWKVLGVGVMLLGIMSFGISLSGCVAKDAVNAINNLIDTLEAMPGDVEAVLQTTIVDLEAMGTVLSKQLARDLKGVEQEAFKLITCEVDFMGLFVKMNAKQIRHDKWPEDYPDPPEYPATICSTMPTSQIIPDYDSFAEFIGFFFKKFNGDFLASIQYFDGTVVKSRIPMVLTSDTTLTVDLQGIDWDDLNLDPERSPRLVLQWEGDKSELLILADG